MPVRKTAWSPRTAPTRSRRAKRPRRRRTTDVGRDPAEAALALLGLARRAGAVALGVEACGRAVRSGEARLLLIASDASSVQLDKVVPLAEHRDLPVRVVATRARLGRAAGRSSLSAAAITESGFAEQILLRLPGPGRDGEDEK